VYRRLEVKQMKIIEPKEMKCTSCGKVLKNEREGFGIPVFKGTYFVRVWTCCVCIKKEFGEKFRKKLSNINGL